jgi:hypothetical protein
VRMMITIEVKGTPALRAGTERTEHIRSEIWDAVDEIVVYDVDEEHDYTVRVTGVAVTEART